MTNGFARVVSNEVLLGHIGDVVAFVVLSQKVIERLVLTGAAVFGDCLIPVVGIRKLWVHVKDDTTEGMLPMSNNLTQLIARARFKHSSTPVNYYPCLTPNVYASDTKRWKQSVNQFSPWPVNFMTEKGIHVSLTAEIG